MEKILIAFASMSGNTEDIAIELKKGLSEALFDVDMEMIDDISVEKLRFYDGLLIGTYTWGDGDLPYEVEDFYRDLDEVDLSGVRVACFGSGDHTYPKFCAAVDLFLTKVREQGAEALQEGLKIELSPESEEDINKCLTFAKDFANLFSNLEVVNEN